LKVLVVDDEPHMRSLLTDLLDAEGLEAVLAADGQMALDQISSARPALVVLDLKLPGISGMVALEKLKAIAPDVPVIILTAYGDIASAVQAMRLGAYHYLTKPLHIEEFVAVARRALEHRRLAAEIEEPRSQHQDADSLSELLGPGPAMQTILQQVKRIARSPLTVLIQGETGTGKEIVARIIHQLSDRGGPFVVVDCGAIPDTLIESELFGYEKGAFTGANRRKKGHFQVAEGGSLFLDEIANLPVATQTKLLRVLQEREVQPLGGNRPARVDVRIVAASNVQLEAEVRSGRFRQDLYYRLNEYVVSLPALRERPEDIPRLADRFAVEAGMELRRPVRGITEDAIRLLQRYPWPGNVRELRNVIRKAAVLTTDLIKPEHLTARSLETAQVASLGKPSPAPNGRSLKEIRDAAASLAEGEAIRQTLRATGGNKSEAARRLRIDYKTLHLKMKKYGLHSREFRSRVPGIEC